MPDAPHAAEIPWQPQRFRAPREDESLLAAPPLPAAVTAAHSNRDALNRSDVNVQGRPLFRLREWSRREVLQAAARYTSERIGRPVDVPDGGPLYVAGHQPSLFHPGVWAKNFAIAELARRDAGISLNLVVDNDTFSSSSIRVPVGSREQPAFKQIAFDEPRPAQPWEQTAVQNKTRFASFGERVTVAMEKWGIAPVVQQMWPAAVERMEHGDALSDCLVAGRLSLERQWGVENLELPNSRLCQLDPFFWFASHILAQLPCFQQIHNQVLREYRQLNHVRSTTHPVPELKQAGEWLEAPFWCWRAGATRRGRVFARQHERELELAIDEDIFARLPLSPRMDACCAVEVMREFESRGIHFRPRALTNTLFARLCLGDLFVHGIGGSKYDEMTDQIIGRFYEFEPPQFLTLSATVYLPFAEPFNTVQADACRLQNVLRDYRYNPDQHLPADVDARARALAVEKASLIAEQRATKALGGTRRERRSRARSNYARYRRLREINDALTPLVARQQANVVTEMEATQAQLLANSVLTDREFSFCLYPEAKLRPFMTDLWPH